MDDKRLDTVRLAIAAARRGSIVAYVCAYQSTVDGICLSDVFVANLRGAQNPAKGLWAFPGGGGIFFTLQSDERAGAADRCYVDPEIQETIQQKDDRARADGYAGQPNHPRKKRRMRRDSNASA